MKNLLIGCGICLFAAFGCRDKTPEPENSIKIEDLVGTWVSVDSMIGRLPDSTFDYVHDFLEVTNDSIVFNEAKKFIKSGSYSIYSYHLFSDDSLNLHYIGPGEIGFVNNNWLHKIVIKGDTLSLIDLSKTYPYFHFNIYLKL